MNFACISGRLTADPKVTYMQNEKQTCIAKYSLAVERRFKRDGQQNADFINCTAMGKNGEFAEKYLHKGTKIIATGHIQTGSYTNKDGVKIYTTDIMIDNQEFAESKAAAKQYQEEQEEAQPEQKPQTDDEDGFMKLDDGMDTEGLPFT